MPPRPSCDLCDRPISPFGHYIVRIDVFADPAVPPLTTEELGDPELPKMMEQLLEQLEGMSAEELQDQVHRRFEFQLCRPCQIRFLINPLGKPRLRRAGHN